MSNILPIFVPVIFILALLYVPYFVVWLGLKWFKIERISRSKIFGYVILMYGLMWLGSTIVGIVTASFTLYVSTIQIINLFVTLFMQFLLIKYYLRISGSEVWKLFIYFTAVALVIFSVGFVAIDIMYNIGDEITDQIREEQAQNAEIQDQVEVSKVEEPGTKQPTQEVVLIPDPTPIKVVAEKLYKDDWGTHRNDQRGFEVKFPEDVVIEETSEYIQPTTNYTNTHFISPEYTLTLFTGTRPTGGPYEYEVDLVKKSISNKTRSGILFEVRAVPAQQYESSTEVYVRSWTGCNVYGKRYDKFTAFMTFEQYKNNESEILGIVQSLKYFGDSCND